VNAPPGRYQSPFRYPGGKAKIANYVKLVMIENDLVGRDYVEPYAGGASVALTLLFEEYADVIHINDINPGVHAFWDAALNATKELCRLVESTPVTVHEWQRQRKILAATTDPLDLGFAAFFLNRTNRSGIIGGGVIGGLDQTGPWKIDARFNKPALNQRIRKVGRYRSRIRLTNDDGRAFLTRWVGFAEDRAFLYLDPPYFVKGAGLYDNFYDPRDHALIAEQVEQLPHPWIVSYDAAPEILNLYAGHDAIRYALSYSANTRGLGSEVMFFADDLEPPAYTPSGVPASTVFRARTQAGAATLF